MPSRRTVIITGAGAAMHYGFPSGFQLRRALTDSRVLSEIPKEVYPADDRSSGNIAQIHNEISKFAERFANSSIASIDAWLDRNPEHFRIGVRLIGHIIAKAESTSRFRERALDRAQANKFHSDPWLEHVFNKIISIAQGPDGFRKLPMAFSNLSFVTFNYDLVSPDFD